MKTDLLVLAGTLLLFASLPLVSHAQDNDWATRSPLAAGEPMEDCDIDHSEIAVAVEPAPALTLPAEKVEAILTAPDVVPAMAPVAPAAVAPVPAKVPADKTTQLSPRPLSPATLLTFALIASPGTALPQTAGAARD